MRPRSLAAAALLGVLALTACSARGTENSRLTGNSRLTEPNELTEPNGAKSGPMRSGYQLQRVGDYFDTAVGSCVVIRVQDQYRLIRCIDSGPIAGCFEHLFSIDKSDLEWNKWIDVEPTPGLKLAFLTPDEFAVTYEGARALGR